VPALENGDVNADWVLDVSDAVYLLSYLFLGGPDPAPLLCDARVAPTTGDADGDGSVDMTDAVRLLRYLHAGGPEPAPLCAMGQGGNQGQGDGTDMAALREQILAEPVGVRQELLEAFSATARYRNLAVALADGVVPHPFLPCLDGLGVPYVVERYYGQSVDPSEPSVLYYVPGEDDKWKLAAVEWALFVDSADVPAPILFGREMRGPLDWRPLVPLFYFRQVHLYRYNPDGLFEIFNPNSFGVCEP
jgi:hypothetical protein